MKSIKYLKLVIMALVISFGAASCMNEDWSDPTGETSPFGNSQLQETNVVSIKSLIDEYGAKQKEMTGAMMTSIWSAC